jgi:hypothetical protein
MKAGGSVSSVEAMGCREKQEDNCCSFQKKSDEGLFFRLLRRFLAKPESIPLETDALRLRHARPNESVENRRRSLSDGLNALFSQSLWTLRY